jgi:hypothetical protein
MSPGRARAPSHLTSPIASVRAAYIFSLSVCVLHMSNESMHCKVPSPNGPCGRMACPSRPKWLAFSARGTFNHTFVTAQHNCMTVSRSVVRGPGRGRGLAVTAHGPPMP